MNIVTFDFETYFDDEYTLRKLTNEAYIRDPRFQVLGCGFVFPDGQKFYADGPTNVRSFLNSQNWSDTGLLAHHAAFDGLILSHHFGITPKFWFDTLSMARHWIGNHLRVGLEQLAHYFELKPKNVPYDDFKGIRWENLMLTIRKELGEGCVHDCDLTWQIFQRLMKDGFPQEELRVIDMTIRMATEPKIIGDVNHFRQIRDDEWMSKNAKLHALGVTEKQLGSNEQFIALLKAEGVEPQYKEGKNGPIPAFAKTDDFMRELLDDPNARVADLAAAKLDVRSTIDETRAGRLADMAQRGAMPVYLNYCGADTLRWSGGDKVNYQNFGRKSPLRRGLRAPKGYKFAVYDKSQIECRLLNFMARDWWMIELFREGKDPYLPLASAICGFAVDPSDKARRGMGKQGELSCGYGSGWFTFQRTAKSGAYGPPVDLSDEQAKHAVNTYRRKHAGVLELWKEGHVVIRRLSAKEQMVWRDLVELKDGYLYGPSGARMRYSLRWDPDAGEKGSWLRRKRDGWRKIWGGVIVQNVMEMLARINLHQGMLELQSMGMRPVGTVHDEVWFLHPESEADAMHAECMRVLSKSPPWAPELPIAVEGVMGEGYEK